MEWDQNDKQRMLNVWPFQWFGLNTPLFFGLPESQLQSLQRLLNTAARIVSKTKRHEHITPVLAELHWLPVKYRLDYKVLLLVYKALHDPGERDPLPLLPWL